MAVFVCPALRERVLAFDARALGRVPVAIGVGAGESKVRPVLGALRAGAIRTLVTDVATAEAVVALDAEELRRMSATATPAILGLDLGTTEVKAGLVDLDGRLLAIARAGYGLEVGHGPGWAEQDPGAWWSAVVGAVRALHPTEPVDIVAIGVDGHGPTLAAVDGRGEATRPAITFLDTRATAEAEELAAATGIHGWALGPLPAALWLERHEPDIAARTRWYLTTWEWLAFRLTGEAVAPLVPHQAAPDRFARRGGDRPPRGPTTAGRHDGWRRRAPSPRSPPMRSASAPASRSRAAPTTPSPATSARASWSPAMPTTRAGRRAGSACTGTSRSRCRARSSPRRRWPACYSVGAAMAATGRALDWFRDAIVGGDVTTDPAARGGRRDAPRRRRRRVPAVPRRRALADLGPDGDAACSPA